MDKVNKNNAKSGGGGSGSLDKVYTLKKASDYLCLSVSTIRKKIKAGSINAIQYQSGGRLMISESEIKRLRSGYPQANKAPDMITKPVIHDIVKPAAPDAEPLSAPDPVTDNVKSINNDIEIGVC